MDTFIVRFYRRTREAAHGLAGTVEHVGSGERAGFADAPELLERLIGPSRPAQSRAPPPARAPLCGPGTEAEAPLHLSSTTSKRIPP